MLGVDENNDLKFCVYDDVVNEVDLLLTVKLIEPKLCIMYQIIN